MSNNCAGIARVLLIDDDPAVIMLIEIGLQDAGIRAELETETSFRGGLHRLQGYLSDKAPLPSLVLVDLNLGDGSGHDLLEFMRSTPPLAEVPAVVLSTSSYSVDIDRATAAGADDYVVKPSSYDDLLDILRGFKRYLAPEAAGF